MKKLLIVSLVLILAIALVIPMAGVSLASSGTAVTIPNLVWQKTVNSSIDATLGNTSHGCNDPYWEWTSDVWDGPGTNGNGAAIDNYIGHENDFWAYWAHEGMYTHKWFKTTVNIDKAHLVGVRLVSKWRGLNLTINDNLYVFVNGIKVAWGGTTYQGGTPPPYQDGKCYHHATQYKETDGWYIHNGLYISNLTPFEQGNNEICILTEEGAGWGGMGKLQLILVYNVNLGNVTPSVDYNLINTGHDVSVDVGVASAGIPVTFKITGITPTITAVRTTDSSGIAKYHYNRTSVGIDQIFAFIDTNGNTNYDAGEPRSENTATKYWVNIGAVQPPGPEFNEVGLDHEVSVNIGIPVAGITVKFASDLPPTEPPPNIEGDIFLGTDTTDGSGNATLTYHSDVPRVDIVYAYIDVDGDDVWDQGVTGVSQGEPRSMAGGSARKFWLANFVTGGGTVKGSNGKVAWTFAGNVGIIGNDIVGQFEIVDHGGLRPGYNGKLPVSYHCSSGNFSYLNFVTSGNYLPSVNNDIASFTGEFSNNRGVSPNPITLTIIIGDGDPRDIADGICVFQGTSQSVVAYWIGTSNSTPPPAHKVELLDGGNFIVHSTP